MTVTDDNTATNDAPPNTINTAPHSPNADTAPDADSTTAENKTSVRQLIDGQEYPISKGDIINMGFDSEAAVEQCMD